MSQVYRFDESVLESTFKGSEFYEMRKNDIFLTDVTIVENILCQGKKSDGSLNYCNQARQ